MLNIVALGWSENQLCFGAIVQCANQYSFLGLAKADVLHLCAISGLVMSDIDSYSNL